MAIVLRGKTECSVCGNVIKDGDEIVATSHFIADQNDPLWRFSDSAMHRSCFANWNHRTEFVAKFNLIVGPNKYWPTTESTHEAPNADEALEPNGTYHYMQLDGTIAVLKRPD